MANAGMGVSQEKGKHLGESSGKFFDTHVNPRPEDKKMVLPTGQRGGQKISKSIPIEGSFRNKRK